MRTLIFRSAACYLLTILLILAEANAEENAAVVAAKSWLTLIDAGKFELSWEKAGSILQTESDQKIWSQYLQGIRDVMGKVQSRKTVRSTAVSRLHGMPDGEYYQIQNEATLDDRTGIERITIAKQNNGWKVVAYMLH